MLNTGSATDKIFWGASRLGEDSGEDDGGFNFEANENYSDNIYIIIGGSAEHRSEKDDCRMGKGGGVFLGYLWDEEKTKEVVDSEVIGQL